MSDFTPDSLTVVMPVYNEGANIQSVAKEWLEELDRLHLNYRIMAYNDGSKDQSKTLLDELAAQHPRFQAIHKPNSGHGPTVLLGYRQATTEWIFQIDSDGEISARHFVDLWSHRESYDLLLGMRHNRSSSLVRRLITKMSQLVIRLLFGPGLTDVNTPYRLMRRAAIQPLLPLIPDDCFQTNLALGGLAVRFGLRIYQTPVPHIGRQAGESMYAKWKIWKLAWRSFCDVCRVAFTARKIR